MFESLGGSQASPFWFVNHNNTLNVKKALGLPRTTDETEEEKQAHPTPLQARARAQTARSRALCCLYLAGCVAAALWLWYSRDRGSEGVPPSLAAALGYPLSERDVFLLPAAAGPAGELRRALEQ